ncbi:unnamed protein product [Parascedosporium putredinis]|uniref:Carboxylesterase type B domain-containing protein n=1 Tax=Parascedosporium putredinis TaxID=1442378 RepID=A0A9P1MAD4_9PEZI|nr:unnamed protein product [Parascedosporium putredinis]CAI7993928.1 unnamed protein product [Parascedosporium putredinis]
MAISPITFVHPIIGSVQGIQKSPRVNQYLGIQYGTLKDRFSRGELRQSYEDLNATELGPIPFSPPNGCEWEHKLLQQSLPFSSFRESDTECLTLNICAPSQKSDALLPVMVLVHGGAFATGSSAYPQYDLAAITELSVTAGKPIRLKRAEQAESSYNSVLHVLGAQHLPQDEQIQALLTATSDDYGSKIGRKFPMAPLLMGRSFPS